MRKVIIAKKTGKNRWRGYRRYVLEKSEIAGFIIGTVAFAYIAARAIIG